MSEMIERVAKAIVVSLNSGIDYGGKRTAKAAIEAMREPTEAMLFESQSFDAKWIWLNMIDAALKDV